MKIFAGAEFDAGGVVVSPHPSLLHRKFELHTPLLSVAHDGAGGWSGHYHPVQAGAWVVRLRLSGRSHVVATSPPGNPARLQWTLAA